jgi:hypothetical protein
VLMSTKPLAIVAVLSAVAITCLLRGLASSSEAAPPRSASLDGPPPVSVTTTTITIPAHPLEQALERRYNATYNMYYYRLNRDLYDPNAPPENRTFTLIVLENEWLKVSLLPELGGRVYQCIFKPSGHNMFYQNPVLKPSPWGPPEQGWWLAAGGMEWGLPVEEHGYEWGIPWGYEINPDAEGAAVTVWDSTASDRLRARITVRLPSGAAYFTVTPRIENPTASGISYKFWLNAMLSPAGTNNLSPGLRFVLDADQVTVHSRGDNSLPGAWQAMSWPSYAGRDMSLISQWQGWLGFFQRPQAAGDFIAAYDEAADRGVVRVYPSEIARGSKGFGFGWSDKALPPSLYTDDDSAYVEIHGGVAPTFADSAYLAAGQHLEWAETWYPLIGLGGLVTANRDAALNLALRDNRATAGVAVSAPRSGLRLELRRRSDGALLFAQPLGTLSPGTPYLSPPVEVGGLGRDALALALFDADGLLVIGYQCPPGTPTPVPTTIPTSTSTPTPTPTSTSGYVARVVRNEYVGGWFGIIRVWVRGKVGLPVTISSADGSWQTVNTVGSKPEYGPDALEFAPLGSETYTITPQGLGVSVTVTLQSGSLAEVVFEPGRPTPTATPSPSSTAPTKTATPTATTGSPTATPQSGWSGRVLSNRPVGGWFGLIRVWVRGKVGLPVTISSADGSWQTVNAVGSKPEYGPDALEFAPLGSETYTITPQGLGVSVTVTLQGGSLAEVLFEPGLGPTPTTTAQPPTATPSGTPAPGGWMGRIASNVSQPWAWGGVVRVSVEDRYGLPVTIWSEDRSWHTVNYTGSKQEYGPNFLEFAPLGAGTYTIEPQGLGVEVSLDLGPGGIAVVLFERIK